MQSADYYFQPLAARMRPRTIAEIKGLAHLLGPVPRGLEIQIAEKLQALRQLGANTKKPKGVA